MSNEQEIIINVLNRKLAGLRKDFILLSQRADEGDGVRMKELRNLKKRFDQFEKQLTTFEGARPVAN
jgi:hypothetical protein